MVNRAGLTKAGVNRAGVTKARVNKAGLKAAWIRDVAFVGALFLARLAFGFQFQSLPALGPELTGRFGLDYASFGVLVGAYMLPGIAVAFPGGMLGRRFGGRAVIGAGFVLMGVGSALAAAWFAPWGIWLGRVVAGTGAVALVVLQGKVVGDRFPGRAFMPVMGLLVGAFPIGVGLVGLEHDLVQGALGVGGLFVVGAALPALCLGLWMPSADAAPAVRAPWAWPTRREAVLVVVSGLAWTAYNTGYYGFLSYMPSVMAVRGHGPGLVAGAMTAATWPNLPATVLGGVLAARIGNAPVMLVGTLSAAVALVGAATSDWPMAWSWVFGTLGAVQAGVIIGVGTLSAKPENRAVAMGVFYTTYYVGGAFLPGVCGAVADRVGTPAGAMLAAAGMSLLALPAFFVHQALSRR